MEVYCINCESSVKMEPFVSLVCPICDLKGFWYNEVVEIYDDGQTLTVPSFEWERNDW